MGAAWVLVEYMALLFIGMAVYVITHIQMDPEMYVPAGGSTEMLIFIFVTTAILFSIPVLLHAGVEAYYRYR